jgi:hypothetical protein
MGAAGMTRQRTRQMVLVGMAAWTLAGCAARSANTAPPTKSPLAKIELGMPKAEVKQRIGAPSAESGHLTGKAFIPLYFGDDAHRTTYYYKGMGRVVFADGNVFGGGGTEVISIDYDPNESGTAR